MEYNAAELTEYDAFLVRYNNWAIGSKHMPVFKKYFTLMTLLLESNITPFLLRTDEEFHTVMNEYLNDFHQEVEELMPDDVNDFDINVPINGLSYKSIVNLLEEADWLFHYADTE